MRYFCLYKYGMRNKIILTQRLYFMKQLVCLSWMLLFSASSIFAQDMTFKETKHDFGNMEESDGTVSHDFQFVNTGDKPLVITQVITGCGCTSAKWSDKPYQPGAKGVIRIAYNPEWRKKKTFSIVTEVFTNATSGGIKVLTVTGKVNLERHSYLSYFDPAKGTNKTPVEFEPKDDYDRILQRVRNKLYAEFTTEQMEKNATSLLKQMDSDGTWPGIDYNCFFRTNWEPVNHLNNVKRMAIAYTCPRSPLYGNTEVYKAITKALKVWNTKKPKSYNWWYNKISAPKMVADILALMAVGDSKLPDETTAELMNYMADSDPRKWTGANKMDIATHHLIRGCVMKNDSIVSANVHELFQPVCITDGEGIREDLSYQQHGVQLYIGGYGSVFVDNITNLAGLFTGTKYAMSQEQMNLFSQFIRTTYLNVFRGPYIDYTVCGRSLSRQGTLAPEKLNKFIESMKKLDPANVAVYFAAGKRFTSGNTSVGRTPQNRMFYCSDYMLHNRPLFDFSIRTSSTRTKRCESGNGENLWGTYISDGATSIRLAGNEYLDIFPVWEWDKVPGTTAPAGERENKNDWGKLGTSTFTGGVSDGTYGAMTYRMEDYGVKVRKAWFLSDDRVVCLGAGIQSDTDKEIHTTINQCHLSGDVYAVNGATSTKLNTGSTDVKNGWIWHNKVAYYLPEESKGILKTGVQTGRWSKINFNQSGDEVSAPVFNFILSHGVKPQNATYAYVIVPGIANPQTLTKIDTAEAKIESNTPQIQAVSFKSKDMLQAVFYAAGSLTCNGKTVTASAPCVVMIKGYSTAQPEILTADPAKGTATQTNNGTVTLK